MNYKALIIDLDGTLVNSEKKVSDRSCTALTEAYNQGIKIIIATARPPRAVKWLLPQQLHTKCSYIYYNGAMISCNESQFSSHTSINSELSSQILDYCLNENNNIDLSIEVEDKWFALKEFDYSILRSIGGQPVVTTLEELKKVNPTKIIVSELKDIDRLINKFNNKVNILVTDEGRLVQISNKEASKEAAVIKLCSFYGIDLDHVIAFGDDTNDIGLFKTLRHTIAMENAVQQLKDIAKEITKSNDEDGVAIVVESICAMKKNKI